VATRRPQAAGQPSEIVIPWQSGGLSGVRTIRTYTFTVVAAPTRPLDPDRIAAELAGAAGVVRIDGPGRFAVRFTRRGPAYAVVQRDALDALIRAGLRPLGIESIE
jgi:hypothetical protein